jgi:hypothetical protein
MGGMKNNNSQKPPCTLIAEDSLKPLEGGSITASPSLEKSWTRKLLPIHAHKPISFQPKIRNAFKTSASLLVFSWLLILAIATPSQSQGSGLSINAGSQLATTQSVTLAWNTSISPNIIGYNIYYGGVSGIYTNEIATENATNLTVPGLLVGSTYYFVVTAVNSSGVQSGFSSQLSYTVASAPILGTPIFSGNGFSFSVNGGSGNSYVIEASTNLISWIPLETNTIPFQFTDENANQFSRRFYRAVNP